MVAPRRDAALLLSPYSGPALPNLTPRHRELVPTPCGPVSSRAVLRGQVLPAGENVLITVVRSDRGAQGYPRFLRLWFGWSSFLGCFS